MPTGEYPNKFIFPGSVQIQLILDKRPSSKSTISDESLLLWQRLLKTAESRSPPSMFLKGVAYIRLIINLTTSAKRKILREKLASTKLTQR